MVIRTGFGHAVPISRPPDTPSAHYTLPHAEWRHHTRCPIPSCFLLNICLAYLPFYPAHMALHPFIFLVAACPPLTAASSFLLKATLVQLHLSCQANTLAVKLLRVIAYALLLLVSHCSADTYAGLLGPFIFETSRCHQSVPFISISCCCDGSLSC